MSVGEKWFWSAVRKDVLGFRIRRQVAIGPYILDFYIPKAKLCVEIDGEQHALTLRKDGIRDAYLQERGILTLRIPSVDLFRTDVDAYSEWIKAVKKLCEERCCDAE